MGLDQLAYTMEVDDHGKPMDATEHTIAEWRKHPNLQGRMENLWEKKERPDFDPETMGGSLGDFNCTPVELTIKDIEDLEEDIKNKSLPPTQGFFFGSASDDEYEEQDLEFCSHAKEEIQSGRKVYYSSWW